MEQSFIDIEFILITLTSITICFVFWVYVFSPWARLARAYPGSCNFNIGEYADYEVAAIYINKMTYGAGYESGREEENNYIIPIKQGLFLKTKAYFFKNKSILLPWALIKEVEIEKGSKIMPKLTEFCCITVYDHNNKKYVIKAQTYMQKINLAANIQQYLNK